ncbi:DMT family transporter [Marinobacterium rhizophilum]|uniref:DMT family transporter n=1 Tax=Marinobacterium rhizophilum TaxID=420402 RepID=A0ABY5HGN6_9GAMM|nr:DMT family transporter [Marinobacterium rhizophilum]UTW10773.1 DMT family transporter [Marinobacterium rhizophilum]
MTTHGISQSSRVRQGLLYALGAVLIWSGFILVSRAGALASLTMVDMLAVRFGTAFLLLAPLAWRMRRVLLNGRVLLLGLVGGLAYGAFVYAGFERAPATHAALLLPGLMPVMIAVMAFFFTAERKPLLVWLGIATSSLGIGALLFDTLFQSSDYWLGDLCFVLACVCWAVYTVLLRAWNIPAWNATVGVVMVAGGLYLPVYWLLLSPGLGEHSWALILGQGFYQGVLATIVQMVFYVRAVQLLGATRMGALMALVPAIAAGLAVPLFGETLTPVLLLSIGLVMLGALLGNLPRRWMPARVPRTCRSSA